MSEATAPFIPGLELNRQFFQELIQPLLAEHLPQLDYTAALIGPGSDVLGYDTARSMDHGWGPRLHLLLPEALPHLEQQLNELWLEYLPQEFRGFSIFYQRHRRSGSLVPTKQRDESSQTRIQTLSLEAFFIRHINIDPIQELSPKDWLSLPEQSLLEMTAGAIYYDPQNHLGQRRQKLNYFPRDIWLYRMACQWQELAEIEAFPGRCSELNDTLGLSNVLGKIINSLGNLRFLQERQYRPYSKWWGSALKPLLPESIYESLTQLSAQQDYTQLEKQLAKIYQFMAQQHNQLQLTPAISTELQTYYDRPFQVLFSGRFAQALQQSIESAQLRQLPLYGGIDQISDQTHLLSYPQHCKSLQTLWQTT